MSNLPAHLQGYQSRNLAATASANLGTATPPYLSIQGNRFTLIDSGSNEQAVGLMDPKLGLAVDVVIIDINEHKSKTYYDKPFDPSAASYEAPACWSDNGVGPSRQAARPQAPTCADCPQAVWGSKISAVSGKGVQACSDGQKVALLVPQSERPDMVFLLRIPPNSLKNFRAYAEKFRGQAVDMDAVVTRLSFEAAGVGTLVFTAISYIDAPTNDIRLKALEAKATDAMIGRLDAVRALPAPAAQPALAAPVQETQQIVVPPQPVPAVAPLGQALGSQQAPLPSGMPLQQAPTTQPLAGGVATASPSEAAPVRKRRTKAEMEAARMAEAGQQQVLPPQSAQAPFGQPAAPAPAQAPFGIATAAPAPNSELMQALGGLFGN